MTQTERTVKEFLDENEFELPIGIEINGEFHKTVKLREMTGVTEEAIADSKVRNNGGKVVTEALYGIIEQIGSVKKVSKHHVREMYSIDRDFLLLMNHKVSIGDEVEFTDSCSICGSKNDITINIDEIPVNYMKPEDSKFIKIELPNGIKGEDGKVHKNITISLPNGTSQERTFSLLRQNPSQAITQLLAYICEDIEGLENWNPETFRNMTKKDRRFISEELGKVEAGVDLFPDVDCANCGEKFKTNIPVQTLLGE